MRCIYAAAVCLLAAAAALAAPPALGIPPEVKPVQGYARVSPKTDAVSVVYVALDGLFPFPSEELKDARRFVLPTTGVKAGRYRYVAVAASKGGEQATAEFVVVVGDAPNLPPITPGPQPEPKPPDSPASYYFLVVRADGPADPAFTAAMGLPAWGELRKKGHQFKDKTVSAAADLALALPPGTALPCVVTLSTAGGVSKIVRGPVALPTTDAGVAALPEGVK